MANVKLSILIATYNSEKDIRIALNSVKSLSITDWECVIIDGKSTDGTLDVVKEYSNDDTRFRFISEKDDGIYDALNKGVKIANGEWIYVLGSDDSVTNNGLKDLVGQSSNYDVVYGNVFLIGDSGEISVFKAKHHKALRYVMNCSHQAVIVRRSVIESLKGFNKVYKIRADFDLLQRAYLAGYKFKQVDTYVANYKTTGFSSMASMSTHVERLHICINNKSTHFPRLLYYYQESKFIARSILNKIGL